MRPRRSMRRRNYGGERGSEICATRDDLLWIDVQTLVALINLRISTAKRVHGGFGAQRLEIGAAIPDAFGGEIVDQRVGGSLFPRLGVNAQNLAARANAGQRKREFAVESSRSSQRAIDGIDSIRGAEDDDATSVIQAIHQRQERRDERVVNLVRLARSHGCQTVEFVEKDDGRLTFLRLFEQQPELSFGFADPL